MDIDTKRQENDAKKLLKSFFAARNKWDKKWCKFFDHFKGDYKAEQKHDAQVREELRTIFQQHCKSDTEADDPLSYASPPTYDGYEFLQVSFPTKKKMVVVVRTGEFGVESSFELENTTKGLKIVSRRCKGLSGKMEKDYL